MEPPKCNVPTADRAPESPLSVDAAILSLAPRFHAPGPITVAGRVAAVRMKEPWRYVDLVGADAQLTCRVPASAGAPQVGREVVAFGVLSVQPSRFKGGIEVLLTGSLRGEPSPDMPPPDARMLERRHRITRLSRLFSDEQLPSITVIATETAWSDAVRAGLSECPSCFRHAKGSFGTIESVVAMLKHVPDGRGGDALAVLRGGGDPRGLDIWNAPEVVEALLEHGLPVYTALGHSTHLLLADRYADESFDTPSTFGSAIAQVLAQRVERDEQARDLAELRGQLVRSQRVAPALVFDRGGGDAREPDDRQSQLAQPRPGPPVARSATPREATTVLEEEVASLRATVGWLTGALVLVVVIAVVLFVARGG